MMPAPPRAKVASPVVLGGRPTAPVPSPAATSLALVPVAAGPPAPAPLAPANSNLAFAFILCHKNMVSDTYCYIV